MRIALLMTLLFLVCPSHAQGVRDKALETQKKALEKERLDNEKKRAAEEHARPELSRPVQNPRDPKACENARVNYQVTCGSAAAPKYRSPSCREAEIFLRQACG